MIAALPLRRTWLVAQLRDAVPLATFARLLRALDPAAWRRVDRTDCRAVFAALWSHVSTLFPVFEPWFDDYEATAQEALAFGIPIEAQGLDDEMCACGDAMPALEMAWRINHNKFFEIDLPPLQSGRKLEARFARAPRGRKWIEPWTALPDLVDYATHRTGWSILDWSAAEVDDGGSLPPWNLDEIRGLAKVWKHAEPIMMHVDVLVRYIGDHADRLHDLEMVLSGDPETRRQLSTPKRGKTLAQIFGDHNAQA